MSRVSTNVVVTEPKCEGRHERWLYKTDKSLKEHKFPFDDRYPTQIIGACVHAKLTTKESDALFMHLATTDPVPAWSSLT